MNNRLCLYISPFSSTNSYLEMVDIAANYGFSYLETLNQYELATPDESFARRLRAYADQKGVRFGCVSVGVNLVGEGRHEQVELAKRYVDIAVILGSPIFHHTIAVEFEHPEAVLSHFDTFYAQGLAAVREIADYAAARGVRTVCEDQGFLFNGVENYGRFLNDVERNIGTVADFGNIMFVDEAVENFIPVFADHVRHVHLKDYILTAKEERERQPDENRSRDGNYLRNCLIGEGAVDFDAAFAALKAMNYSGLFSLESPPLCDDEEESFRHNIRMAKRYIETL